MEGNRHHSYEEMMPIALIKLLAPIDEKMTRM